MTMQQLLDWARGPMFVASMVVLGAGLLRVLVLNFVSLAILIRRSRRNGRTIPWRVVLLNTYQAMRPAPIGRQARGLYSMISIVFHVCIIVAPLFLAAHVLLWKRGLGLSWPTLSMQLADGLTLAAIVSTLLLLLLRIGSSHARAISRPQDHLVLLLILTPFISGFLAMHPALNPLSYVAAMVIHVISGNLILILIPFSKIVHVALLPLSQLFSELGWHLEPSAGERVALELHKENEAI